MLLTVEYISLTVLNILTLYTFNLQIAIQADHKLLQKEQIVIQADHKLFKKEQIVIQADRKLLQKEHTWTGTVFLLPAKMF
jgi:hypothetical protein